MFVKRSGKRKLTIDVSNENYELLTKFGEKHELSSGAIINSLISYFLGLSQDAKLKFAKTTIELIQIFKSSLLTYQDFEAQEKEAEIALLKDLVLFFTDGKGYIEEEKMKKAAIADGYVIYPKEWIAIDLEFSNTKKYVGVIEMRNGNAYNAPHFLFFSDVPIGKIDNVAEEILLNKCQAVYPEFRKIRAMQIEPIYGENHEFLNGDLWNKAPIIGIFSIPTYGEASSFPAGAMIVRTGEQ